MRRRRPVKSPARCLPRRHETCWGALQPPPRDADGSGARRGADAHYAVAMAREAAEQYGGAAPGAPLEARRGARRAGHRRAREHAVALLARDAEPRAPWGRSAPQLCRDMPLARAFSVRTAPCPRIRLHSQTAKAPWRIPGDDCILYCPSTQTPSQRRFARSDTNVRDRLRCTARLSQHEMLPKDASEAALPRRS